MKKPLQNCKGFFYKNKTTLFKGGCSKKDLVARPVPNYFFFEAVGAFFAGAFFAVAFA